MANPLCLPALKARLGITVDTYDVNLQSVLNGVWVSAKRWLGYDPTRQERTQYYSGSELGSYKLYLGVYPVIPETVIVYVAQGGYYGVPAQAFGSEALWQQGVDYSVMTDEGATSGVLMSINQPWPWTYGLMPQRLAAERMPCVGCVKATFTGGLSSEDMADLLDALYTEAAARARSQGTGFGAILSDSMDGASVSVSQIQYRGGYQGTTPWVSPLVVGRLLLYRRVAIGRL